MFANHFDGEIMLPYCASSMTPSADEDVIIGKMINYDFTRSTLPGPMMRGAVA